MLLCVVIDGSCQLSGIRLLTHYAPVTFQSTGLSRPLSLLVADFNTSEYLLAPLISIWIIDKVDRRALMIWASAGQSLCMMTMATTAHDGSSSAGVIAAVTLFLCNIFFALGWLTISKCVTLTSS